MKWALRLTTRFSRQIGKLDRHQAALILGWLEKNIDGCDDPRRFGKSLTGDRKGVWRYRIGSYRILCRLEDDEAIVLALEVGHRRDIYRRPE